MIQDWPARKYETLSQKQTHMVEHLYSINRAVSSISSIYIYIYIYIYIKSQQVMIT
jgi:hypothetical protein